MRSHGYLLLGERRALSDANGPRQVRGESHHTGQYRVHILVVAGAGIRQKLKSRVVLQAFQVVTHRQDSQIDFVGKRNNTVRVKCTYDDGDHNVGRFVEELLEYNLEVHDCSENQGCGIVVVHCRQNEGNVAPYLQFTTVRNLTSGQARD